MVLTGVVWVLFMALQTWLILVSMYAWQVNKYKKPVAVFWICQVAVVAAQVLIVGANYITPIPWMLIYICSALAYLWLHDIERELNSLKLAVSMLVMALYCGAYIYLSSRHERYGDLNYILTVGLNVFTIWQGALLFGGAKKIIKNRIGG